MSIELFPAMNRSIVLGGPARVSVTGDSIMADAYSTGGMWLGWGMINWLRRFLADRIDLPMSRMYAVASKTVAQVYAEQFPSALEDVSQIVIDNSGTNSIGTDTADIIATKKLMYDAYRAAGKTVVIIGIRAHKSPSSFTADQKKQVGYINQAFRNYARENANVLFFDPDPYIIDWATGEVQSGYFRDGIHDNIVSAKLLGGKLADSLSTFLPLIDRGFVGVGDIYDGTLNSLGNMLTNGLLVGTSGTNSNGATGTPPTGWTGQRSASGSTTTLAVSKEADSTYGTLERAVLTYGGTADGAQGHIQQAVNLPAGVAVGDTVEAEAYCDWNFAQPMLGLCLRLRARDAAQASLLDIYDGFYSASNGLYPAGDSGSGKFKIALTVPASTASLQLYLMGVAPSGGGSVDAVIKWSRASLRKLG